jgi:hypothetical protein
MIGRVGKKMKTMIFAWNFLDLFNSELSYNSIVPNGRRFGHVYVVCNSWCSPVWAGRGEKWAMWVEQGD